MTTHQSISTPSKTIDEFLHRHPEVQTGPQAKAELEAIHDKGDTFCEISKIFDNTILHQDYDGDSRKRVFAFALVDDAQALARYKEDAGAENVTCECKIGGQGGAEHHLHERIVVVQEAECEKHKERDEPDPDCSACWPVWSGSNCQW
ncbi:hypothetical protein ACHAPA_011205 [Fusarium lateritium]